MTIPAYSRWYPKGYDLILNVLDTVIFKFIVLVFDDLKHFLENTHDRSSMSIKWYSLANQYLI